MTAPTLAETLRELARVLPSRVKLTPIHVPGGATVMETWVWAEHDWRHVLLQEREIVWRGGHACWWVETMVREECEARGLTWHIDSDWNGSGVQVMIRENDRTLSGCLAPTPAEAMAAALLAALAAAQAGEGAGS